MLKIIKSKKKKKKTEKVRKPEKVITNLTLNFHSTTHSFILQLIHSFCNSFIHSATHSFILQLTQIETGKEISRLGVKKSGVCEHIPVTILKTALWHILAISEKHN